MSMFNDFGRQETLPQVRELSCPYCGGYHGHTSDEFIDLFKDGDLPREQVRGVKLSFCPMEGGVIIAKRKEQS